MAEEVKVTKAKFLRRELLHSNEAKWTRLVLTTYQDPLGATRDWESAERPTRPAGSTIDGVGIVAILQNPDGRPPEILLQKQYRPPLDKVVIEVPAGLIDAGETPEQCALRELKEETGYIGKLDESGGWGIGCILYNDPGFCNTNLNMIHVTIDLALPENKKPKPQLEENEFIECFSVPLRDLPAACKRLEGEGYAVDARVGTLAEGINLAQRWKLFS